MPEGNYGVSQNGMTTANEFGLRIARLIFFVFPIPRQSLCQDLGLGFQYGYYRVTVT